MTLKYNASGTLQWDAIESAANAGLNAEGRDITVPVGDCIFVTGMVENGQSKDFLSIQYKRTDGTRQWVEQWDDADKGEDIPTYIKAEGSSSFYVGGKSWDGSATTDILIKYDVTAYTLPPDDDTEKPASFTFFENKGQLIDTHGDTRPDIKFYTTRQYPSLYFQDDTLSYVFAHIDTSAATDDTLARIGMSFYGSLSTKTIQRAESQGGEYLNYYLPQCPTGATNVRHSDRLYEKDVYSHVDVAYYGDNAGLKYYIIIHPGWNSGNSPIQLKYDGADSVIIQGDGKLRLKTAIGQIILKQPETYQINGDGSIATLAWTATYSSPATNRIGFTFGTYNTAKDLVIEIGMDGDEDGEDCEDNVLWGTLYGGSGADNISDVKIFFQHPAINSLYIAGQTQTTNFPLELNYIGTQAGGFDYFIQKFNLEETPFSDVYQGLWGTYIGGSNTEYSDYPGGPKMCQFHDDIAFVGQTLSNDIPVMDYDVGDALNFYDNDQNALFDGLLGVIDASGNLKSLTYLGGDGGYSGANSIAATTANGLIIVGRSSGGADFPFKTYAGTFNYTSGKQGFILDLDENLHTNWGTLFGAAGTYAEHVTDVSIDLNGDYILTGIVGSAGLPTTAECFQSAFGGDEDAFIAKINHSDRTLSWCTYYGGSGGEEPGACTVDNENAIYVCGVVANSGDVAFPLLDGGEYFDDVYDAAEPLAGEGFMLKFDANGNRQWATYFGGNSSEDIRDIYSNGDYIAVTGTVTDEGGIFPLNGDDCPDCYFDDVPYEDYPTNKNTAYLSVFGKDTRLLWSTFLGDKAANYGKAIGGMGNTLYVTGSVFNNSILYDYKPLCDAGGEAYYETAPVIVPASSEGFINAFDLDPLPDYIPLAIYTPECTSADIKIYPNPTSTSITIELISNTPIQNIDLYNTMGQVVLKIHNPVFINHIYTINVQKLISGTYFLHLQNDTSIINQTLLKD